MPSLLRVQRHLRAAVLRPADAAIATAILEAGVPASDRLAIYRNHYRSTLTAALAATFPAVQRLVGEEFFAQTARSFIAEEPPVSACLFEYGAGFPAFLAGLPALGPLPYVAEVARFEWLLNACTFADDASPLGREALARLAGHELVRVSFSLHPSVHLFQSDHAVAEIWTLCRSGSEPEGRVERPRGQDRLLLQRCELDAGWRRLGGGEFAFLQALKQQSPLGAATESALAADPLFDLAAALHRLLEDGTLTGLALI